MNNQLIIDLQMISEEGILVIDDSYGTDYTDLIIGICPVLEPVHYHVEIQRNYQDYFVQGHVKTKVVHPCTRCLRPVPLEIIGQVEVVLLSSDHEPKEEEVELKTLENVVYYRGLEFDLLPYIQEAILLGVPNIVLCRQDCAGLCGFCGQDLNQQPDHECADMKKMPDERFLVLEKLKRKFDKEEIDPTVRKNKTIQ